MILFFGFSQINVNQKSIVMNKKSLFRSLFFIAFIMLSQNMVAKDVISNQQKSTSVSKAAPNTYRYLRLTALGAVDTYDIYFTEIEWMVGTTAYPLTKVTGSIPAITATVANNGAWKAYNGVLTGDNAWQPGVSTYPYSISLDLGAGIAIAPKSRLIE